MGPNREMVQNDNIAQTEMIGQLFRQGIRVFASRRGLPKALQSTSWARICISGCLYCCFPASRLCITFHLWRHSADRVYERGFADTRVSSNSNVDLAISRSWLQPTWHFVKPPLFLFLIKNSPLLFFLLLLSPLAFQCLCQLCLLFLHFLLHLFFFSCRRPSFLLHLFFFSCRRPSFLLVPLLVRRISVPRRLRSSCIFDLLQPRRLCGGISGLFQPLCLLAGIILSHFSLSSASFQFVQVALFWSWSSFGRKRPLSNSNCNNPTGHNRGTAK